MNCNCIANRELSGEFKGNLWLIFLLDFFAIAGCFGGVANLAYQSQIISWFLLIDLAILGFATIIMLACYCFMRGCMLNFATRTANWIFGEKISNLVFGCGDPNLNITVALLRAHVYLVLITGVIYRMSTL